MKDPVQIAETWAKLHNPECQQASIDAFIACYKYAIATGITLGQ